MNNYNLKSMLLYNCTQYGHVIVLHDGEVYVLCWSVVDFLRSLMIFFVVPDFTAIAPTLTLALLVIPSFDNFVGGESLSSIPLCFLELQI